jgi:uncharacterized protein (UPF0261 family)
MKKSRKNIPIELSRRFLYIQSMGPRKDAKKTIALVGTLDTKGEGYAFVKRVVEAKGLKTLLIDTGIFGSPGPGGFGTPSSGGLGTPSLEPDVTAEEVARAAGETLAALAAERDRGRAAEAMGRGLAEILPRLHREGRFHGVLALGGGGGTSIATHGMRALPIGVPKVMVSTMAGRDVSGFVGVKDIVMVPSLVDIEGLNRISRGILAGAAGAVCGMVQTIPPAAEKRELVAATMFGNTTPAVKRAAALLEKAGYEVLVFPCSGTSGRVMEALIAEGHVAGVLDITTTEWADELVGGVLSAGPERLEAASRSSVPQVVAPGCLDMVNFWAPDTVPERFRGRRFYGHNPNVTLMRTTPEENRELGRIIASKLNTGRGKTCVLLPLGGVSMLDRPCGPFWWPEADEALFESLKKHLRKGIDVVEIDRNINDGEFADACAERLLAMLEQPTPNTEETHD